MITRPLRPADLAAALVVRNAVEEADALPIRTPIDELEEELTDEGVSWADDTRGVFDDEACVAYAWTRLPPGATEDGWNVHVHVAVHPDRTKQGHGRALLEWAEARGIARLASLGTDQPCRLTTFLNDTQSRAGRMLTRAGFAIERYYDELTVTLEDRPSVGAAEGVALTPWDADVSEAARRVKNSAFEDHWGSVATPATSWKRMVGSSRFQPDMSTLAWDGDDLVGVVITNLYPEDWPVVGREESFIHIVAVLASHRGRGIAKAMIDRTLTASAAAGLTHTTLGVDTANPTGAHALYTGLGFVPTARNAGWAKPVHPAA